MSSSEDNWEKVNAELNRLNKKYLHKHSVILNTSPPRVGKTINTILHHIDDNVPLIVFVDNEKQAKDLYNKLLNIIEDENVKLYYWRSKPNSCSILKLTDDEIKEEEDKESIEDAKSKIEMGINYCKECNYQKNCQWRWQKRNMNTYDVVLMNKHNIGTVLIDDDNIFYKKDEKRSIIYDEEIDKPYLTDYEILDDTDIELFNKIYNLTSGFDKLIDNHHDFIDQIDLIKEILNVRVTNKEIL